jgi:hypothetical protein
MFRSGPDGNLVGVINGMSRSAEYRTFMLSRFEIVQEARGKSLTVSNFAQKPSPNTVFDDIEENPEDWKNVCFARYFGLTSIQREAIE